MKKIFYVTSIILVLLCNRKLYAQSLPVGTPVLEDYYRRMQLLNGVDSNISFTVRPILSASAIGVKDIYFPDGESSKDKLIKVEPFLFNGGRGSFRILPLTLQQQFNSDHPYGWNDGPMIPARGYQTMISGGVFLKYGILSIQIRPEFVYAANPKFDDSGMKPISNDLIDNPDRYGNGQFSKAFWGQSSIRLTFDPISIGLSNENVWWGPGIVNSLILSNNAPGFKHIILNTVRPINTFVGSFEGHILAGRLDASGYQVNNPARGKLRTEWRYFTGFNLNYHPRWIPGFTLGLTRTFSSYHSDVQSIKDYIPFFFPYQKKSTEDGDPIERDQYTSLYARWLFTKAQAEVYFEYGVNDNSYNYRDFIMSPDHARAYIFGVRKMIPLYNQKKDQYILFSTEVTQLSQNADRDIRGLQTWYVHGGVRQGHTNLGQVLGAGIGPGSNIQSVDISWVSGLKKLGVGIDRYDHNATYTSQLPIISGNSRNWVDFAFSIHGDWNYRNFLFNARLQHIKSLNYQWILKDYTSDNYYIPHNTVYNIHGELGLAYRF